MTAPPTTFDPPADQRLVLDDGTMNPVWVSWFDHVGKALEALRESTDAMSDLDPGVTTLTELTTAWETLRGNLQEII